MERENPENPCASSWWRMFAGCLRVGTMRISDDSQPHAVSLTALTRSQDHDKVKRTLDEFFNVKLETRDISLKGWNWGKADVQGE